MTISNSVRAFGGGPSSLWQSYNWNAFKWGEGTVKVPMAFVHLVSLGTLGMASTRGFQLTKLVAIDPMTLDSARGIDFTKGISNSLGLDSDSSDQFLFDSEGYFHVFPGNTTDANERVNPTWAAGAANSTTWTSSSVTATTWSAA